MSICFSPIDADLNVGGKRVSIQQQDPVSMDGDIKLMIMKNNAGSLHLRYASQDGEESGCTE